MKGKNFSSPSQDSTALQQIAKSYLDGSSTPLPNTLLPKYIALNNAQEKSAK